MVFDDDMVYGPTGWPSITLSLPGVVDRGNATQAIAAAVVLGDPTAAVAGVSSVSEVAGRCPPLRSGRTLPRILLAETGGRRRRCR